MLDVGGATGAYASPLDPITATTRSEQRRPGTPVEGRDERPISWSSIGFDVVRTCAANAHDQSTVDQSPAASDITAAVCWIGTSALMLN